MLMKKKYGIPIISVISFDVISALAIAVKVYTSEGYFPSVSEVFFSSPICYFWLLWSALIFYASWGIYKEYEGVRFSLTQSFPDVPQSVIDQVSKYKFLCSYSKKTLLVFAGLPLIVLGSRFFETSQITISTVALLLIPFICDCLFYIFTKLKLRRATDGIDK